MNDFQLPDLYRSVDKFDTIGAQGVERELLERGIAPDAVKRMIELITTRQLGVANLDVIEQQMGTIPTAADGLRELRELAACLDDAGVPAQFYEFDFTMVRGLGYYTGPIFETIITEPNLGSVTGGGRYDDLVGLFRKESLPTVGTSLGIERIIDLMDILNLYPPNIVGTVVEVLVTVFNEESRPESARLAAELRRGGIRTELYMQDKNLGKQFDYANKKQIPLVAVLGPEELSKNVVKLKRLGDGTEVQVARSEAIEQSRALVG
ncbi:MAG: His/Gly/Thr/Pro-type tRNA ligase C-terminal domain-containing protein [Anaerolineae bacterium]